MKIFGTRFWGFDPQTFPFVGFTYEGSRNSLISMSTPGDLVVILGTMSDPTADEDKGKLLGLIEFERTAAYADDLVPPGQAVPEHLLNEGGKLKWPFAVPAIRAWQFDPPVAVWDVLGRQLTMAATSAVDPLSDAESALVLALPRSEVLLPESRARVRDDRIAASRSSKLDPNAPGQPGPPPSEWSAITAREDGATATYLLRFGERDVWKLGISKQPKRRCEALNFSVPVEVLNENWSIYRTHQWPNGASAYDMEQALLKELTAYRGPNERVKCSEGIIKNAWDAFVMGLS